MAIRIRMVGSKYAAEVTPPHGEGRVWTSAASMALDRLIETLQALGCHQTDIGDALSEADPDWLTRLPERQ